MSSSLLAHFSFFWRGFLNPDFTACLDGLAIETQRSSDYFLGAGTPRADYHIDFYMGAVYLNSS